MGGIKSIFTPDSTPKQTQTLPAFLGVERGFTDNLNCFQAKANIQLQVDLDGNVKHPPKISVKKTGPESTPCTLKWDEEHKLYYWPKKSCCEYAKMQYGLVRYHKSSPGSNAVKAGDFAFIPYNNKCMGLTHEGEHPIRVNITNGDDIPAEVWEIPVITDVELEDDSDSYAYDRHFTRQRRRTTFKHKEGHNIIRKWLAKKEQEAKENPNPEMQIPKVPQHSEINSVLETATEGETYHENIQSNTRYTANSEDRSGKNEGEQIEGEPDHCENPTISRSEKKIPGANSIEDNETTTNKVNSADSVCARICARTRNSRRIEEESEDQSHWKYSGRSDSEQLSDNNGSSHAGSGESSSSDSSVISRSQRRMMLHLQR